MSPPGQGGELLVKGQILDHQVAARAHGREERRQEGYEEAEHRAWENPGPGKNRPWFQGGRGIGEAQVDHGAHLVGIGVDPVPWILCGLGLA